MKTTEVAFASQQSHFPDISWIPTVGGWKTSTQIKKGTKDGQTAEKDSGLFVNYWNNHRADRRVFKLAKLL